MEKEREVHEESKEKSLLHSCRGRIRIVVGVGQSMLYTSARARTMY